MGSKLRRHIVSYLLGSLVLLSPHISRASLALCEGQFVSQSAPAFGRASEVVVSARARARVSQWILDDRAKAVSPEHASSVRTVKGAVTSGDRNGKALRTKFAVQMLHGLYNSPKWMDDLAGFFHGKGMNIVNTRLPGHYEKQLDALDRVNRRQWVEAAESGFRVATDLGERVILVGHSTGGVLASMMAVKNPGQVAAIVLFSPAYRVSTMSWIKAAISSRANIGYVEEGSGRYISGEAGQQVVLLGKEFWAELAKENPGHPMDVLEARLRHVPILMIDTALDKTIEPGFNRIIMHVLADGRAPAVRSQLLLTESDRTLHNAITLRDNGSGSPASFNKIETALESFLSATALQN